MYINVYTCINQVVSNWLWKRNNEKHWFLRVNLSQKRNLKKESTILSNVYVLSIKD